MKTILLLPYNYVSLLTQNQAQLINIRFKDEYDVWHMPAS